jgi:hypothetical protein
VIRIPALALCVLSACSSHPSKSDCDAMVEHMVDLFTAGKLADENAKLPKDYATIVENWRKILKDEKDPTHETLLSVCTSQMAASAKSCVLAAHNESELAACFGS